MPNKKPVGRTDDLVVQEANGEILIYDLRANKAFCLNETSSLVWKACDGTRNISELQSSVGDSLGSTISDDFIWLALDQLKKDSLVENVPDMNGRFDGLSRRDVIRKIAVGSMVALPVVAGLVAPPAYAQASVCAAPCDCGNNGNTVNCGQRTCATGCSCLRTTAGASAGTCG